MRRLGAGLICFFALNLLWSCASSNSSSWLGKSSSKETSSSSTSTTFEYKTTAVIPESAQVCRVDARVCLPIPAPAASVADKAAPVVELPETTHDLGVIQGDGVFTHKFIIKNKGESELVIKKILPGRGSRVARYDRAIPPGGEGNITLSIDSSACTNTNKISKGTLVTCNDPVTPCFFLYFTGRNK